MTRAGSRRRDLAVMLGGVAGSVDAIGYRTLFELFTGHMTGNTVATSAHVASASWHEALRRGFPIPLFVCGAALGTLVSRLGARRGARASFLFALAIEAAALLVFGLVGPHVSLGPDRSHVTLGYFALAALPALAMGLQAATLRCVGDQSIRTTFVTGMLTSFGEQLVRWRTGTSARRRRAAAARARLTLLIWMAYASGAVAGALAVARISFGAVVLPLVGLGVATVLDLRASAASPDEGQSRGVGRHTRA